MQKYRISIICLGCQAEWYKVESTGLPVTINLVAMASENMEKEQPCKCVNPDVGLRVVLVDQAPPENGAARLLKLLTSLNLEDEYLDSISTYGLTAELVTLIKRAGITEAVLAAWEQEKREQFIGWQPAEASQAQPPEPEGE